MPGTRTTTSVGPILGARYPIDAELVSDEVNLNECDRTASGIVYKEPHGQGKFGAVIADADGNERHVVVGATAAVNELVFLRLVLLAGEVRCEGVRARSACAGSP